MFLLILSGSGARAGGELKELKIPSGSSSSTTALKEVLFFSSFMCFVNIQYNYSNQRALCVYV